MTRCFGIIDTEDNVNYGKQCLIYCKTSKYCTQHHYQRNNREYCIKFVTLYLDLVQNATGRLNKIKLSDTLFRYLVFNKDFLNQHNTFKNAVIKKLNEFITQENLKEFMIYKKALLSK
jgi:hypothetical protein